MHYSDLRALTRPATLVPVLIVAFLFGSMGAGYDFSFPVMAHVLLAAALLTVANGGSNILNELGDMKEDSVHPVKQDRVIVSGAFSPVIALSAVMLVWFGAIAVSLLLLPVVFAIIYIVILGFAWVYSFPPRLKERLGWNYLAIGTPRGALGIAAAWSVYGHILSPELWVILSITIPYILLGNESRNIDDRDADIFAGVRNITTIWGERAGRTVMLAGFVFPLVGGAVLFMVRRDPVFLAMCVPAIAALAGYRSWKGKRLWYLFYGGFAMIAIAFWGGFF